MKKNKHMIAKTMVAVHTLRKLPFLVGGAVVTGKAFVHKLQREKQKKKGVITMKKSTFVSLIVFLSAVAGALAAGYVYLMKRERELDEYEQMLFSEDFEDDYSEALDDCACTEPCEGECGCGCAQPAQEEVASEPAEKPAE